MYPDSGCSRLISAALLALVPACGSGQPSQAAGNDGTAGDDGAGRSADAGYEVVATDLEVPWDLAFAPDGRIFVTERPGRIRVIAEGELRASPWAELDVTATGEAGLTSIALAPDFEQSGNVYVLGTFQGAGGLENRVIRLTDENGQGTNPTELITGMPSNQFHTGSALEFGPDGLLYVTVGDAGQPQLAQDLESVAGKLLRYAADGTPAPGNPLGGPIYAIGFRNTQGLDWDPSGQLFASEHGPSGLPAEGGRSGNDELNRIVPRGNYGWPEVAGTDGDDRFIAPLAAWSPAIAPSGLAVYTGDDFPDWNGNVFIGALRGRQLRRIALRQEGDEWSVVDQEALFDELGRIRAVRMGPDGSLYFTTSNRDGRGNPAADDDRILRLIPEE